MGLPSRTPEPADVTTAFRTAHGPAVAALTRRFGDLDLAEDAVQDAFVVASGRWPTQGVPPNPTGWIITTARNGAVDSLRRQARGRVLLAKAHDRPAAATTPGVTSADTEVSLGEDQLRLIFTCCHPALSQEAQIALTLRLLGGLSVAEVAAAFLVSESTMAKRLVRAKYKIRAAQIPFRIPDEPILAERLGSILAVVSLIYTTGANGAGQADLRSAAIQLAQVLRQTLGSIPEVLGLLALLLLNEARWPARFRHAQVVLLPEQDRTAWDPALIRTGQRLVRECLAIADPGPYQIQAAIQAVHCNAGNAADTDWGQILTLYETLYAIQPTPVVALNRAIAVSEVAGPNAGLAALSTLGEQLDDYYLLHATRAKLLRDQGDFRQARGAYERALALAKQPPDQAFLQRELAALPAGEATW